MHRSQTNLSYISSSVVRDISKGCQVSVTKVTWSTRDHCINYWFIVKFCRIRKINELRCLNPDQTPTLQTLRSLLSSHLCTQEECVEPLHGWSLTRTSDREVWSGQGLPRASLIRQLSQGSCLFTFGAINEFIQSHSSTQALATGSRAVSSAVFHSEAQTTLSLFALDSWRSA